MNRRCAWFRYLDYFSMPITLSFENDMMFRTNIGAVITLMLSIVFILLFAFMVTDLIEHPQYKYHTYEKEIDSLEDQEHYLDRNSFYFAIYSELKPRADIAMFSVWQQTGNYYEDKRR